METEGLVYATKGEIYLHLDDKEVLLAKREGPVWALAFHNGELYDAGRNKGIFNTLHNKKILEYGGNVLDLCSHNGELYGCTCGDGAGEIFNALTGKVAVSRSSGCRYGSVYCLVNGKAQEGENFCGTISLCSVGERLYEINEYGSIIDSFANKEIKRGYGREALHLHKGKLYSSQDHTEIREVFSEKRVASREYAVSKLCTHNGELYDAGHYNQICKTFSGEIILIKDHWITALCSVDSKLVERILKKAA